MPTRRAIRDSWAPPGLGYPGVGQGDERRAAGRATVERNGTSNSLELLSKRQATCSSTLRTVAADHASPRIMRVPSLSNLGNDLP